MIDQAESLQLVDEVKEGRVSILRAIWPQLAFIAFFAVVSAKAVMG